MDRVLDLYFTRPRTTATEPGATTAGVGEPPGTAAFPAGASTPPPLVDTATFDAHAPAPPPVSNTAPSGDPVPLRREEDSVGATA